MRACAQSVRPAPRVAARLRNGHARQPATATPAYAAQTKLGCGSCHTSPSGGGGLTARGKKFKDNGGSIPANIIICGNNDANGHYLEPCKETGHKPHPARFPVQLPLLFIRFLTDPAIS